MLPEEQECLVPVKDLPVCYLKSRSAWFLGRVSSWAPRQEKSFSSEGHVLKPTIKQLVNNT